MRATLVSLLLLAAAACGEAEPCAEASERLRACFGDDAAAAYAAQQCDPARAAQLPADCTALAEAGASAGKADQAGLREAVREAIREAIREAVTRGLEQVWQQTVGAAVPGMASRALYLQLYASPLQDEATRRALELAEALASDPDFEPLVVELEPSRHVVLHGPCPLDPGSDLPRKIADLVVAQPELVRALGGSIEAVPDGDSVQVRASLPLVLLAFDEGAPARFGCR